MPSTVEARLNKIEGLIRVLLGRTGGAPGASALDDLTDVTITTAATGDIIRYNGSAWVDYPDSNYASSGDGVTNGNSHDHSGGDGAQINHTTLSNIGTNTHAQIDTHIADSSDPHGSTLTQTTIAGTTIVTGDHGTAATDEVVNVCYGTGSAPTASTTTEGTLWIKYTA